MLLERFENGWKEKAERQDRRIVEKGEKKTMSGFVPVFRDWKLPDTGETRPRRINNDARQRPFANIEAYVTIHCRAPMFLPSSKFNLTFQIPSLSSLSSIFLLRVVWSFFVFLSSLSLSSFVLTEYTQWFFDVSHLMVISMEKKHWVHGVRFTGEEKLFNGWTVIVFRRILSSVRLPANCFFFFLSIPAKRNGAARRAVSASSTNGILKTVEKGPSTGTGRVLLN